MGLVRRGVGDRRRHRGGHLAPSVPGERWPPVQDDAQAPLASRASSTTRSQSAAGRHRRWMKVGSSDPVIP